MADETKPTICYRCTVPEWFGRVLVPFAWENTRASAIHRPRPAPPPSPRLSSFPGDSPAYSSGTMPSRILRVFSQCGSGLKHCGHELQDSCCNQRQTRRKRWQELQSARRVLLKEKVIGHSGEHEPVFSLMKRCV